MYALRTERVEPSLLPAAGIRTKCDSANEDYRWTLTQDSPVTAKRLQKSETLRGNPSEYHPRPPPLCLPTAPPGPRNKPDFQHGTLDIPYSSPSPFSGLTLIQPLVLSGSRSDLSLQSSRTLPHAPHPARVTNPLSPRYQRPSPEPTVLLGSKIYFPYPTASLEPGEWRNTSPVRRGALDVSDIEGASPCPSRRPRKIVDEQDSLEFGDVTKKSTSPSRQRQRDVMRSGRAAGALPEPYEAPRLGIWAGSLGGDSGSFLATHRSPTNPNNPSYEIHGKAIIDDGSFGRPKQHVAPADADLSRRTWRGSNGFDDPKSVVSQWQALEAKKKWPDSPTRRYATAVKQAVSRVQAAVAEVAALP